MQAKSSSHAYSELTKCNTNNATRIGWDDWDGDGCWPADYLPENKKAYYRHLDRHNSGRQNGRDRQNKSYQAYELNRTLIQCMSDKLRLGAWEIKRAIQWFDALQRSNMGIHSKVVAFSTCAYIVHRFDDRREYHPQTKPDNRDFFFEECREDFDISHDWFQRVYGKVENKIRNDELTFKRQDTYEIDANAEQQWRTRNDGSRGWL